MDDRLMRLVGGKGRAVRRPGPVSVVIDTVPTGYLGRARADLQGEGM